MRTALLAVLLLLAAVPAGAQEYDRSAWRHWTDEDRDCRSTRHEVLADESLIPPTLDARGCRVVAGLWLDVYTGAVHTDPRTMDIDHVVPLAEAHRSGGEAWDAGRRRAYANGLGDRWHLVAVGRSVNRSKGARPPDEWLPPDPAMHCWYVTQWLRIKDAWGLSYRPPELRAIAEVLAGCPAPGVRP